MRPGIPFVVSAPSGVGKSTLIRELRLRVPDIDFSVSHTTRPPRTGETDGSDYHFVDRPVFEHMVAAGEFVEWAEVHGNLYGTSLSAVTKRLRDGRDVVLDIDVQGAAQVSEKVQNVVLIFVLPPSWQELRRRIETRRLDARQAIDRRMENARGELSRARQYDYLVINDLVKNALAELAAIIRAERCRTTRRADILDRLLNSAHPEGPGAALSVI